jgi:soluble lytic murein transglycosylase-like protein
MNIEEALIILKFDGAAATNGIRNTRTALNDLTRGASDYGRQLGASLSNVAKVTAELSVMGRGIATAFNSAMFIPNLVNGTAEATRNMGQFAANVGMSAERIRGLQQFMGQLGGSNESTNSFIADLAKRKAALESGFASPMDVMPKQFFAGGGDYNKALHGTAEEAIAEYAKVYENLKKQKKQLGGSDTESEAYASQQMLEMGIQTDMLQVIKLGNVELQKRIDLEAKRVPLLGKGDLENAKIWRESWAHIEQSIENAGTSSGRGITNIAVGSGYVKAEAAFIDKQLASTEKSFKAIAKIISDPSSLNLKDLKEIIAINPLFEKLFEWLSKISNISLDNIKNPIKSIYESVLPVDKQQRDQNIIGNMAAFLGDKDAIAAKATIDKYDDGLALEEKLKAAGTKYGFDANKVLEIYSGSTVDKDVLLAQAYKESRFNPSAGSPAGARGFSQFMPSTAKARGLDDVTDPIASAKAQRKLMEEEYAKYGDVKLALAAYNGGEGGANWLSQPQNRHWLDQPDARIKGDAKHNSLYRVETADYGKTIPEMAAANKAVNTKDLVQQPAPAQGATITNNVEINVKSTDPHGAAVETKTAIENLNKSAAYQSGMQ